VFGVVFLLGGFFGVWDGWLCFFFFFFFRCDGAVVSPWSAPPDFFLPAQVPRGTPDFSRAMLFGGGFYPLLAYTFNLAGGCPPFSVFPPA